MCRNCAHKYAREREGEAGREMGRDVMDGLLGSGMDGAPRRFPAWGRLSRVKCLVFGFGVEARAFPSSSTKMVLKRFLEQNFAQLILLVTFVTLMSFKNKTS